MYEMRTAESRRNAAPERQKSCAALSGPEEGWSYCAFKKGLEAS